MSPKRDPRDITPGELEAIIEVGLEVYFGHPANRGTLATNIEAMRSRLAAQQEELRSMARCALAKIDPEQCADFMVEQRKLIASTQERLTAYEAMAENQN